MSRPALWLRTAQVLSAAGHVWELKDDGDPADVYDWARLAAHVALPVADALVLEEEEGPEQCWGCGEFNTLPYTQPWPLVTVDNDPGDPEVGPQPDIIDVPMCPKCRR